MILARVLLLASVPAALTLTAACGGAPPPPTSTTAAPTATPEPPPASAASSSPTPPIPEPVAIPTEDIQRTLRLKLGMFRTCYEKGHKADPKLAGRVTVKIAIDKDGKIASAVADDSSPLADPKVRTCVADAVKTAAFPAGAYSNVNVVYGVTFQPPANEKGLGIVVEPIVATKQ